MSKIAQPSRRPSIFLKKEFNAVIWPNGEAILSRPRKEKVPVSIKAPFPDIFLKRIALMVLATGSENAELHLASYMGLSIRPIFDTSEGELENRLLPKKDIRGRKGLTGITSYGKRMVRNSTHLLQEKYGRARCIFATVTIPDMPVEEMGTLHEGWHRLVEYYRLGIRRELKKHGLSGQIITVSEIQEKRYEVSNLPILHLHSVFVGVDRSGKFAISTERHDQIWANAVQSVVNIERNQFSAACNLQRVRKSASAYLSKYMSKGARVVSRIVDQGLGNWLPKHWWNCSRSLASEVKGDTWIVNDFSNWLYDMAHSPGNDVWRWHDNVLIDLKSGKKVLMAIYGRLDPHVADGIITTVDPW